MSYPKISIHVVNYNGGEYLPRCLQAVKEQDYPDPLEILVVDNASKDESVSWLKEHHPGIRLIQNSCNAGFAAAHNQAIRASDSWAVLVLNFDVVLGPDYVRRLANVLTGDPSLGSATGKLYRLENQTPTRILDSTGVAMQFYFPSDRGQMEIDRGQYDLQTDIFGACGAAVLYRREMLEDIACQKEYFDEDYGNYVEDVDLAWRARLRGWECRYDPDAVAHHERGVTRKKNPAEQYRYLLIGYRNRYWTVFKNLSWREAGRHFFKMLIQEALFFVCEKPDGHSRWLSAKALAAAILGIFPMWRKRRRIQSCRRVSPGTPDPYFGFEEFDAWAFLRGRIKGFVIQRLQWVKSAALSLF